MSVPSKHRSGRSHDFFPPWSKLSRIVGEIKSKRKSLHPNLPVDFMDFPLFPVPTSSSSSSSSSGHKSSPTSTIANPPAEDAHAMSRDVADGKQPSSRDLPSCFVPSSPPSDMCDAPRLSRKKRMRQRMTQLAPWIDPRSPNTVPAECAEMAALNSAEMPPANPIKKKKPHIASQLFTASGEVVQADMADKTRRSAEMPESGTIKKKKSHLASWLSASSAELCQSDLFREKIARIGSFLPTRYAHMLDADTLAKKMSHMPSRPLFNAGEPTQPYQVEEGNLDMSSGVSGRSVELAETELWDKRHTYIPDLHSEEFYKEQCEPISAEKANKEENRRAGTDLDDLLSFASRKKKSHVGAELSQQFSLTNSPEMKKICNAPLRQGAKLAVLTILCLCLFCIGKELAVLITMICYLLSMLTSRLGLSKKAESIQRKQKSLHGFDQGNHPVMQEHKSKAKYFFRSSTIPAQGRGPSSLSVPAKEKATRSRSLPRMDVALSEANHVTASSTSRLENTDFSLCKEIVSPEGKGVPTAILQPKIVVLFILSGLIFGRVIAVCTASCCILILFKLQKWLQARG